MKANNKCMEDNDKKQEFYYLNHWEINNLYGGEMPQKLPVDGFKWVGNISQFKKDFIKNYNKHIMTRNILLKFMSTCRKITSSLQ